MIDAEDQQLLPTDVDGSMQQIHRDANRSIRRIAHGAGIASGVAVLVIGSGTEAVAQTDFYNLDKGRPIRVEDAYATERYAFEVQIAPLGLAQDRGGAVHYLPSIELEHGLFSGFEVSGGANLAATRGGRDETSSGSELELSGLLNLTVETATLPALAVRVTGHLPVDPGDPGDHGANIEVRGIATRSLGGPVRAHLNGAGVIGGNAPERWWGGVALDYVLPFQHTLLLVETYVAEPDAGSRRVDSAAGFRYQISPTLALDAGAGRSWTGAEAKDWFLTVGLTHEFGVRGVMPSRRR